ncbi:CHAP domain-containing protein [Pararoseomonas indoligenes]|uniref:CHAP domain-containing protein n=1 Tax=Roseomonas indoligenes TaxID=2820811 RepID=A0A940MT36_9PROT|nr:CHAP domain-containing protein [Pararoseomonas indoligenes]MBP0492919.1 CHAP domain-containing protein [Pararoseomonas indoligenes]
MMLAPELSSTAEASSTQRGGAKHVSARSAPAAQNGRAVAVRSARGNVTKAASRQVSRSEAPREYASYGGYISCVPYARMVTGMNVSGNGGTWWNNAAGAYARGNRPEPGSVLVFRASGGMRSGHVAVVERQVSAREITIHHANWEGPGIRKGTVTRNISVVDVSDANDWTAVRVQVGHDSGSYGRTYATYGFIFNRPDGAPAQRGPIMVRNGRGMQEVAEAPATSSHLRFINTSVGGLGVEGSR